jgi:hypothetical protein
MEHTSGAYGGRIKGISNKIMSLLIRRGWG